MIVVSVPREGVEGDPNRHRNLNAFGCDYKVLFLDHVANCPEPGEEFFDLLVDRVLRRNALHNDGTISFLIAVKFFLSVVRFVIIGKRFFLFFRRRISVCGRRGLFLYGRLSGYKTCVDKGLIIKIARGLDGASL